jgi:hypothetical protein
MRSFILIDAIVTWVSRIVVAEFHLWSIYQTKFCMEGLTNKTSCIYLVSLTN